jgi:hypothetical protein
MQLSQAALKAATSRAHAMGFALNEQMVASILVAAMEASGEPSVVDEDARDQYILAKIDQITGNLKSVIDVVNAHGDVISGIQNYLAEQEEAVDSTAYHADSRPEGV